MYKKLVDNGIINAFVARPSVIALKYICVKIFGTSNAKSMYAISNELRQHDFNKIKTGIQKIYIL